MSGKTTLQGTDAVWNVTVGCTRVTTGCDACYAFALHDRRHAIYQANGGRWSPGGEVMPAQYARPFSEIQVRPVRLDWPLHQKKPQRIVHRGTLYRAANFHLLRTNARGRASYVRSLRHLTHAEHAAILRCSQESHAAQRLRAARSVVQMPLFTDEEGRG
jgi:hypothetical protein